MSHYKMKNIVLLQFHKEPEVVQNRIDLLKYLNPNTKIHGLFGGPEVEFSDMKSKLLNLETLTFINEPNTEIKWKRRDLSLLEWFRKTGSKIDFDYIYSIEYDLLILENLEKIYRLTDNSIALTGLIKINDIHEKWDWITDSPYKEESYEFLNFVKDNYKISEFYACLGPGAALSKSFLQKYDKISIPNIAHEELRIPALAQIFGMNLVDTGFYDNWNSKNPVTESVFNCNTIEVPVEKVLNEYRKEHRFVFHPVYEVLPISKLVK